MALTDAELTRIAAIETMLNTVQTALNRMVSQTQMRQLLLVKQAEVDALTARVAALEAQVLALQSKI